MATTTTAITEKKLVVATRLHLGQSTEPPNDLESKLDNFAKFCDDQSPHCTRVVAVDAQDKIPGYSLVSAVTNILQKQQQQRDSNNSSQTTTTTVTTVLPVQPWGQFVPACNALVNWSQKQNMDVILFVSAETSANSIQKTLLSHMDHNDTLVVGAVLPGHDYTPGRQRALTGVTSPWNTLALWNVHKLSLTGFQLISDAGRNGGVEEVVCIAVLQKLLGQEQCKAKLVRLDGGVQWKVNFTDPARQEWHQRKMKSKLERPAAQLEALHNLSGIVYHI